MEEPRKKAKILYNISIPIKIPNSDKSQWTNVGVIVQTASGKVFGKINFMPMPVGSWDGSFNCFDTPKGTGTKPAGDFDGPLEEEPAF